MADALLHPQDRAYTVPEIYAWLDRCGMSFGRWIEQAPYLAQCGILARSPHASRLAALPSPEQHAAAELFRGTMVSHSFVARRDDSADASEPITFAGDSWRDYVPIRLPWTVNVRERLPPGSVAVLINKSHTFTDLILTVDRFEDRLLGAIDGRRTLGEILQSAAPDRNAESRGVRFFERLWQYDQVVFDASRTNDTYCRWRLSSRRFNSRANLETIARKEREMPKTDKPNILVIWGDDIGIANLSCYSHGLMGYQTPNIDRIAKEGMLFTDSYGEQSCTAGRSSFITGQSVYRTGPLQGRHSRRSDRDDRQDHHHRRGAQEPGLRDRPVRQEPSRRPQLDAADQPRLRRVLTAISITSTQRKSRKRTIIPTRRSFRTFTRRSARAASCTPSRRIPTIRPLSRAGAGSASRRSRTPARSPGSAWRPATTISSRAPRNS